MGKVPFDKFEIVDLPDDLDDYRDAFDARFLRFRELKGKPRTVLITQARWLKSSNKSETKKQPLLTLQEFEKPWAINVTNCETIAQLYGNKDPKSWVGKRVTLYPTKTRFGSEVVDCMRVKDTIPADPQEKRTAPAPAPEQKRERAPLSAGAQKHMQNIADATLGAQLDTVEEELTEDNTLSPDETALLVRALTKRRGQLEGKPSV